MPKTNDEKENTRRLIVVLEQACLETYRIPSSSGSKQDDKYMLLNADDHQGILARMGREVATARPDITHQASYPLRPEALLSEEPRAHLYCF